MALLDELRVNSHELLDPVRTGVSRANGREPVFREPLTPSLGAQQDAQLARHLRAIPRQQEVLARRKKVLGIAPG